MKTYYYNFGFFYDYIGDMFWKYESVQHAGWLKCHHRNDKFLFSSETVMR